MASVDLIGPRGETVAVTDLGRLQHLVNARGYAVVTGTYADAVALLSGYVNHPGAPTEAEAVADPSTPLGAALRTAFVAAGQATTRLRAGASGDSTTAGDLRSTDGVLVAVGTVGAMDTMSQQAGPRSWFTHACGLSGGRLVHVYNDGQASDRSPAMLARFPALLARGLDVVFLGDAHNDFSTGSGLTEANTRSNIDAMVKLARAAGVEPILTTNYPDNNTAVYAAPIRRHNIWLKQYAHANRILLVDKYAAVVDPTSSTGQWVTANQLDGTHASYLGAKVAGQAVVNGLSSLLRGGPAWLPSDNSLTPNRMANGLFVTNTAGVGTNWNKQGTNTTATIVTDAAVLGSVQQIDITGVGGMNFYQNATVDGSTLRIGDRVKWAGMVKVTAAAGSLQWWVDMQFPGAATAVGVRPLGAPTGIDYPWAYFECEAVIPAGSTQVRVGAYANTGTGTIYLAQQGLYNLSLGAVAGTAPF